MQTDLPEGWKLTTLGQITRVRRGASPRPIDSSEWFANEGPGWVRITDVTRSNGRLHSTEQYLSPRGVLRSVPVKPGQLIMSICATIGEPAIVEIDVCIHDGFVVFDQYEKNLDTRFLYYFLRYWMPQFRAIGQTGTQANLNTNIVNATHIIIPPFSEQQRIAEILNTVDETIAHTEALIQKLKQIKAGLLHDLLTCGLDENGELRDAIAHPEQFKDSALGQIPKDWEVDKFKRLADAIDPQPDHRAPPEVNDGEPYIGVGDFRPDRTIDFNSCRKVSSVAVSKQQQRFSIELGDIIFGKIGTIGLPKFLPKVDHRYALNANTVLIKPRLCPSFVLWLLQSNFVEKQIQVETHSTSQPAFGILRIRAMLVPIPKLEEQIRIITILDAHESRIRAEETYLNKLKLQKKGLMHDLLTGKVRVNQLKNNSAISTTA